MSNLPLWYRVGFRDGKPFTTCMQQIGTNETNRSKQFFLAPFDAESGETDLRAVVSVAVDSEDRPNGFFGSLDEAKVGAAEALQGQVKLIEDAVAAIQEL